MNYRLPQLLAERGTLLPLSEVFGPTIQGEGPYCGRRAVFVRLGRCNLSCTWCDTPYTWDTTRYDVAEECPDVPAHEIADRAVALGGGLYVLTGGEPLMHQHRVGMVQLLARLGHWGEVHVETNGTITPQPDVMTLVNHFTVSPKLANNGADPARRRIKPKVLETFAHLASKRRACFKFVVRDFGDLAEVADLVADHLIPPHAVWIMPEGTTADTVLARHRDIAAAAIDHGWNTTTRLHTLLWGEERGR